MNLSHVTAVLRREMQEIVKSRGLLLAIFLPPFFITLIPLIAVAILGRVLESESGGDAGDFAQIVQLMPELRTWSVGEVAMFVILQQFLTFFLMMPLIISLSIAAQSIVGEKQNKSLEPLLATPIKTGELLFAKGLAAMLPAVLATWAAFIIFIVVGRFLIASERVFFALLDPKWLIAMLVLAPLLSLLSVNIAVVLSARVNDTRAVQQIGGFVVLPIVLLGVAQTTGFILLNALTFVIGAILIGVIDLLILQLGVRLFQREKILTQWK
ncbi:MAG: ABC transporter permease [Chloroflexi bacterium]|nr:ABC transporter permease [Chloroflexota bacterium]